MHSKEIDMDATKAPDKETVRRWLEHRQREHKPPPDLRQIRRELGWGLNSASRARKLFRQDGP